MAKFFLIGEVGDGGVWLVDVEGKSVERIEETDLANSDVPEGDIVLNFNQARMEQNNSLFRGVNLAVTAESRMAPASHNRRQVHA
jgi:hypothetical protein